MNQTYIPALHAQLIEDLLNDAQTIIDGLNALASLPAADGLYLSPNVREELERRRKH